MRVYDRNGTLRTPDGGVETEAYGSGAAALVPFKGLEALVEDGMSAQQIGRVYGVPRDLVIFRAKVTKPYRPQGVGLEDNVYYRRGETAESNAQLVERAVRIVNELNQEIATPAQAREMLSLSMTPSKY